MEEIGLLEEERTVGGSLVSGRLQQFLRGVSRTSMDYLRTLEGRVYAPAVSASALPLLPISPPSCGNGAESSPPFFPPRVTCSSVVQRL